MTSPTAPDTPESIATRGPGSLVTFFRMIKLSHSVFALPFALAAAFLASEGWPDPGILGKIVLACVFARTAAMAFNRWADARIDARNPRTASREIPAGKLKRSTVGWLTLLFAGLFIATAAWINPLAFALSPVALVVLLGYSLLKRFTSSTHLVLGLALGLSPVGAWIAIRGEFALVPVVLGLAVACWTAGFDVIYACQDVEFDRETGLHSLPEKLGIARALWVSRCLHVIAVGLLLLTGHLAALGVVYLVGVGLVAALLIYEQSLVRADDLSRVNLAFFTLNGLVSLVFMATVLIDRW